MRGIERLRTLFAYERGAVFLRLPPLSRHAPALRLFILLHSFLSHDPCTTSADERAERRPSKDSWACPAGPPLRPARRPSPPLPPSTPADAGGEPSDHPFRHFAGRSQPLPTVRTPPPETVAANPLALSAPATPCHRTAGSGSAPEPPGTAGSRAASAGRLRLRTTRPRRSGRRTVAPPPGPRHPETPVTPRHRATRGPGAGRSGSHFWLAPPSPRFSHPGERGLAGTDRHRRSPPRAARPHAPCAASNRCHIGQAPHRTGAGRGRNRRDTRAGRLTSASRLPAPLTSAARYGDTRPELAAPTLLVPDPPGVDGRAARVTRYRITPVGAAPPRRLVVAQSSVIRTR